MEFEVLDWKLLKLCVLATALLLLVSGIGLILWAWMSMFGLDFGLTERDMLLFRSKRRQGIAMAHSSLAPSTGSRSGHTQPLTSSLRQPGPNQSGQIRTILPSWWESSSLSSSSSSPSLSYLPSRGEFD